MPGTGADTPASLTLSLPPELFETIAQRAAKIVLAEAQPPSEEWLYGAQAIADYLGWTRKRVYNLVSRNPAGLPIYHDPCGRGLFARRSELDAGIRDGGNRP
jgi:hypothetical protein